MDRYEEFIFFGVVHRKGDPECEACPVGWPQDCACGGYRHYGSDSSAAHTVCDCCPGGSKSIYREPEAPPQWTTAPPTAPGFYWMKFTSDGPLEVVRIQPSSDGVQFLIHGVSEFFRHTTEVFWWPIPLTPPEPVAELPIAAYDHYTEPFRDPYADPASTGGKGESHERI
jgi:hypothetical protein